MIRPEKHTFKWSPKTKSKEDLELVKVLEQLVKDQNISKTQLTRKALTDFVKIQQKRGKIMAEKGYQGYENWETWNVSLWLSK